MQLHSDVVAVRSYAERCRNDDSQEDQIAHHPVDVKQAIEKQQHGKFDQEDYQSVSHAQCCERLQ